MANKPLGAAFSAARASGEDQSRSAQRRRANQWLKDHGHSTMSRKVAKGILDRWRAMTPDERMDEFNLRAMRVPPEVARALAMQGNAKLPKRQGLFGKSVAKASSYATAYRDAAKAQLDPEVHAAIHRHARASAGGTAARVANRGRSSDQNSALLKRAGRLRKRAEAILARVDKMGPTLSEVHTPAPNSGGLTAGPPLRRKKKLDKSDGPDMTPPQAVQSACQTGLDQATDFGGPGLTEGAKARARSMASGKPVTVEQARRIAAFHARHGAQAGPMTQQNGDPTPKAVALNLWGGKAGAAWAKKLVGQLEKVGKAEQVQKRAHVGSSFDDYLIEQGMREEVEAEAQARVDALVAKGGPGSGPQPGGGSGGAKTAQEHLEAARQHIAAAASASKAGDTKTAAQHYDQADEHFAGARRALRVNKAPAEAVEKRHMVAQLADRYVQAAYGAPQLPPPQGTGIDPAEIAPFLDAQRLVAGMDQELSGGADTPTMARARASAALATNMGAYDRVIAGPDRTIAGVGGLNLDLGSGQARERGFLGVDTFPYDYGTVIHDLGQGIPFPDGSARAVRLNNVLDELDDYRDDPTPLMLEIQRVLGLGGKFYYVGKPLQDLVDWSVLPGLGVVSSQFGNGGRTLALTLQRIPAKLPLVYGADTNFLSVDERCPADLALAQATFGAVPPADVAMANLVHKREHVDVQARVLKKDDWEHTVLGAVLVPDEQDSQGDVISAEEIRATAHNFLANARVVGKEHTETWDGGEVVESYLAPADMEFADPMYGPQKITKGTWVLGVRVPEADWPSILDGSFTGFSVGGWGEREDLADG